MYCAPRSLDTSKKTGVDHHAVLCAGRLEEPGGDAVAETAGAEVHADPDAILLVGEEVDVVVAAADGA